MKIKTKKQLNLPQLIEEIVQNDIINTFAELKSEYPAKQGIQIDRGGRLHLVGMDYLSKNNTFTVTTEEELTESTVIPKVLNIFKNTVNRIRNDEKSYIRRNVSIKEIKESSKDYIENDRLYIMNDDLTMTLIWHDGKLVE